MTIFKKNHNGTYWARDNFGSVFLIVKLVGDYYINVNTDITFVNRKYIITF